MKAVLRVTVGDLTLRNSEVEDLEVTQELGQHTRAALTFVRDAALDVQIDQLLGKPLRITVQGDDDDAVEIFQGTIVDGSQTHLLNLGSKFRLEAISPSARLEYRDTVYFRDSTVNTIAGKFGVKIVGQLRREPQKADYVQWNESEFDFLRRLADEHGGFLHTVGAEPEIRTEFKDTGTAVMWGLDLLEVSARARPVNHGFSGASYQVADKHTHVHAGIRQTPPGVGGASRLVGAVNDLARTMASGGDPGLEEPDGRSATHADYKAMLRRESERALGSAVLVEGMSTNCALLAGNVVDLVPGKNFTLPTTGKLGLIKVVHSFHEQHYANRFVATPWKQFTALERPPVPRMPGPVVAHVVEVGNDPDGLGRVRVKFPWLHDQPTGWARVAVPHAGNGRGIMFLPEVDDEVLVIFEHGDVESPIVIGALWNGVDRPPESTKDNTAKRIVTRSGNTIQFLDDQGEETIEIHTPEGKCLIQLTNKGGHPVVTLSSDGDIALQAKEQIRMHCKELVQIVDADAVRSVGGDDSVEAKGKATIVASMDLGLA
ncbi:MAG: type VI secretion system Vgr family protein, partial [Gemmatimonadales bacterium]